jgi:hypothetical protein
MNQEEHVRIGETRNLNKNVGRKALKEEAKWGTLT